MVQKFEVRIPEFRDAVYDIREYGAVGDGVHSNTEAFRKAMEAAAKTGGRLLVPDGICIKSGKNREARRIPGPSENIYIHHGRVRGNRWKSDIIIIQQRFWC